MAKKEYLSDTVWYGDLKGTMAFDIGKINLPLQTIEVEGHELLSKAEFHCSIVAARKYAERVAVDPDEAKRLEAEIVEAVRKSVNVHPLEFKGLTGDYYLCEQGDEVTIIGLVRIDGVDGLLQQVKDAAGVTINPPKLHVTLYKNEKSPYGIGIRNEEDFVNLCRELPSEVLAALRDDTLSPTI